METATTHCKKSDGTDKKVFRTEDEAKQFGDQYQKNNPTSEPQRPYLCPDCGSYHLTYNAMGDSTRTRTDWEEAGKYQVRSRRTEEEKEQLRNQVLELFQQGATAQQVADQLRISIATVYGIKNSQTVQAVEIRKLSIQEQIAALQQQLLDEEKRKQEIIESRLLQVRWGQTVSGERIIVISQNDERFTALVEDAQRLHKLLAALLAEVP